MPFGIDRVLEVYADLGQRLPPTPRVVWCGFRARPEVRVQELDIPLLCSYSRFA